MENFETEYTYDWIDVEEGESEEFVIDSASKAEWAIEQITEKQAQRDYFVKCAEEKIQKLKDQIAKEKEKCDNATNFLTYKLAHFMEDDDVPKKKTKTQITVNLPAGKIIKKLPKLSITTKTGESVTKIKDKDDFVKEVESIAPQYIKTKKEVDWGAFKKQLTIMDDSVMVTETGEIIDSLGVTETPASVEVKPNV